MQESQYSSTHSLTTALDKGERSTFRYDFQKAESDSVKCGTSTPAYCIKISTAENIPLQALIKFSPHSPLPICKSQTTFQHYQLGTKSSLHVADMPLPSRYDHRPTEGETWYDSLPLNSLTHIVHELEATNTIRPVGGFTIYVTIVWYYN